MPAALDFVIPSEARDLHFAANCGSLAPLGMTISKKMTILEKMTIHEKRRCVATTLPPSPFF